MSNREREGEDECKGEGEDDKYVNNIIEDIEKLKIKQPKIVHLPNYQHDDAGNLVRMFIENNKLVKIIYYDKYSYAELLTVDYEKEIKTK